MADRRNNQTSIPGKVTYRPHLVKACLARNFGKDPQAWELDVIWAIFEDRYHGFVQKGVTKKVLAQLITDWKTPNGAEPTPPVELEGEPSFREHTVKAWVARNFGKDPVGWTIRRIWPLFQERCVKFQEQGVDESTLERLIAKWKQPKELQQLQSPVAEVRQSAGIRSAETMRQAMMIEATLSKLGLSFDDFERLSQEIRDLGGLGNVKAICEAWHAGDEARREIETKGGDVPRTETDESTNAAHEDFNDRIRILPR